MTLALTGACSGRRTSQLTLRGFEVAVVNLSK